MPPLNTFQKTCIGLAIGQLAAVHTHAATINVSVAADSLDTVNGGCTLRKAILSINDQALRSGCQNAGAAFGTDDTIIVTPSLSNSTITLQGQELTVGGNPSVVTSTTIQANGITIDANNQSRAFNVDSGDSLSINGISIINGEASGNGGAILVGQNASLTLVNSILSSNKATRAGGAIRGERNSRLVLSTTTISNNSAPFGISNKSARFGGAISTLRRSTLSLQGCAVSGNPNGAIDAYISNTSIKQSTISDNGGATSVENFSGTLLIEQSSIFNNNNTGSTISTATYSRDASTTIINSTVSNNTSLSAIGLRGYNYYSIGQTFVTATISNVTMSNNSSSTSSINIGERTSLSIQNSIVTSSGASSNCFITPGSVGSVVTTDASSIIKNNSCGGMARAVDPLLGPLQDNGGPTLTHLLTKDSPAFNSGNNATCSAFDQRGEERPLSDDDACDVGAFEFIVGQDELDEGSFFVVPTKNGKAVIFEL